MKTLTFIGCTLGIGISLSACGADPILLGELIEAAERGDDVPAAEDAPSDFDDPDLPVPYPYPNDPAAAQEAVEELLLQYCGECHQAPADAGGLSSIGDVDELVTLGLIIPGSQDDSPIYVRIENETMPPFPEDDRPTRRELMLIGAFINLMDD